MSSDRFFADAISLASMRGFSPQFGRPIRQLDFFRGTFAPFLRASESPIAIACARLFTRPPLPPLPDLRVPRFLRSMALFTDLAAAFPYLAITSPF
jgi:hypothetical protein